MNLNSSLFCLSCTGFLTVYLPASQVLFQEYRSQLQGYPETVPAIFKRRKRNFTELLLYQGL